VTDKTQDQLRAAAFLKDIEETCKKHNMSISHEDGQGAFLFTDFNEQDLKWLKEGYWRDVYYAPFKAWI
jgi:hypothetical protein